jgi:hypothetical protein
MFLSPVRGEGESISLDFGRPRHAKESCFVYPTSIKPSYCSFATISVALEGSMGNFL